MNLRREDVIAALIARKEVLETANDAALKQQRKERIKHARERLAEAQHELRLALANEGDTYKPTVVRENETTLREIDRMLTVLSMSEDETVPVKGTGSVYRLL